MTTQPERPPLALVLAADRLGTIGRDGGLPWRLPKDLRHFKRLTLGHPMVMGRRTFESFGGPLPKRRHLVLSRDPNYAADGVEVVRDLDAALDAARGAETLFVVGGATLFADTLPLARDLHLTRVEAEVDGDVRLPERFWAELERGPEREEIHRSQPIRPRVVDRVWHRVSRREYPADARHDHPFAVEHYRRDDAD